MVETSSTSTKASPKASLKVSVILNIYNRADFLSQAIDSILQQSFKDFELLIVDDCSTNPEVLAIAQQYAGQDSRIRIIEHEQNKGLATARNSGLQNAQAEFIALMDDDDISHPARLAKQVAFLESHPEVAAVGCPLQRFSGAPNMNDHSQSSPVLEDPCSDNHLMKVWLGGATNPSAMFRRDALQAVGGWRKWFLSAEDFDMSLRLIEHYSLAVLGGECLLYYRKDSGNKMSVMVVCWHYAIAAIVSAYHRRRGHQDPVDSHPPLEDVVALLGKEKFPADARAYIAKIAGDILRHQIMARNFHGACQVLREIKLSGGNISKIGILTSFVDGFARLLAKIKSTSQQRS